MNLGEWRIGGALRFMGLAGLMKLGRVVESKIEEGFLRLDFTRWKHKKSQAQKRCYTAGGQKMAFRVVGCFRF
ncbi:hypothetical protein PSJM300_03040 [Stutzerimonas stutzeri DSM 10701]|nr:hypothetical protein PSJM300_03040 [Stutzerimonas stutzeri DSM 10701]